MLLADFDYSLPSELIAQNPAEPRDSARLLVYERLQDRITHAQIKDIPELVPASTVFVANNSKVRQARLFAMSEGRKMEVLILEPAHGQAFRCLLKGHGLKEGRRLSFLDKEEKEIKLTATIQEQESHPGMNTWILEFNAAHEEVEEICRQHGAMPFPPYITESQAPGERYQPVFAKHLGSAAAPTAGLHFTPELIEKLRQAGHTWEEVTLHVGLGTFLPLRDQEITRNKLHTEATYVSDSTAKDLEGARASGKTVLTVGTTSTRTLESRMRNGKMISGWDNTELFIYPGYVFKAANALLTNFHLPKSSLLTLVAAFLGNHPSNGTLIRSEKEMVTTLHRLYNEAVARRYRFYSFGDAMLIL